MRVGVGVGTGDGAAVGIDVGKDVGFADGAAVGSADVGPGEGALEGDAVGSGAGRAWFRKNLGMDCKPCTQAGVQDAPTYTMYDSKFVATSELAPRDGILPTRTAE